MYKYRYSVYIYTIYVYLSCTRLCLYHHLAGRVVLHTYMPVHLAGCRKVQHVTITTNLA